MSPGIQQAWEEKADSLDSISSIVVSGKSLPEQQCKPPTCPGQVPGPVS